MSKRVPSAQAHPRRAAAVRPAARPLLRRGLRSPMYAQVYATLREWIFQGFHAPGSRLPTEAEMSKMFGVSRITTRQAVELLVNEQLVSRQQGRGTFVATDLANAPVRSDMEQLLRKLKRLGTRTRITQAQVDEAIADDATCRDLRLRPGARVIVASHVRLLGQLPIGWVVTYIPKDFRIRFDLRELNRNPMLTLLERKGIALAGADQFIGATLADTRLAGVLQTDVGAPLVTVRLIVIDSRHRRVERLLAYYRADHYTHHSFLTRS